MERAICTETVRSGQLVQRWVWEITSRTDEISQILRESTCFHPVEIVGKRTRWECDPEIIDGRTVSCVYEVEVSQ